MLPYQRHLLRLGLPFAMATGLLTGCSELPEVAADDTGTGSPYLLVLAGDHDEADEDFLLVLDVDPASGKTGDVIATLPIGHTASMPHHMEYSAPPSGEPIFMNAHHPEASLLVDFADIEDLKITRSFAPEGDLRFPHDYYRTPTGRRLVSFLRSNSDGGSDHGGIAEYSAQGELLRQASAAVPNQDKPIRPYSFALLPDQDRLVVTSAPMMEKEWADVVQIYRYSDFELLHTIDLPDGVINGEIVPGSGAAGFGAKALDDGSVFFNSYGCSLYHLTAVESDTPQLDVVHTIKTAPAEVEGNIRGACGVPLLAGDYWIQTVGQEGLVLVFDISDPAAPRKVERLETPSYFYPHWLSLDPAGDRIVMGSEMGYEEGFFILRFNEETGALSFDARFDGRRGTGWRSWIWPTTEGYISLDKEHWPHGSTGKAWGHAAVFVGG